MTEGVNADTATNNTLVFAGDSSDGVELTDGASWSTSSNATFGGQTYDIYTHATTDAQVLIDADIVVSGLPA